MFIFVFFWFVLQLKQIKRKPRDKLSANTKVSACFSGNMLKALGL